MYIFWVMQEIYIIEQEVQELLRVLVQYLYVLDREWGITATMFILLEGLKWRGMVPSLLVLQLLPILGLPQLPSRVIHGILWLTLSIIYAWVIDKVSHRMPCITLDGS